MLAEKCRGLAVPFSPPFYLRHMPANGVGRRRKGKKARLKKSHFFSSSPPRRRDYIQGVPNSLGK